MRTVKAIAHATLLLGLCGPGCGPDEDNTPMAAEPELSLDAAPLLAACDFAEGPKDALGCYAFTLTATKTYHPSTWNGDAHCFCRPFRFVVPASIPVTAGNAGNQSLDLFFIDARTQLSESCRYKGGSSHAHPASAQQVEKGRRYEFRSCTNGKDEGDALEVSSLRLHIVSGDSHLPSTAVSLALSEAPSACATDTAAPVFTSVLPAEGATVHAPALWLFGSVADAGPVEVTASGLVAKVVGSKFLGGPIPLSVGTNAIVLQAEDARGQRTAFTRTVIHAPGSPPVPPDLPGNQAPVFLNEPLARRLVAGTTFTFDFDYQDPDPPVGCDDDDDDSDHNSDDDSDHSSDDDSDPSSDDNSDHSSDDDSDHNSDDDSDHNSDDDGSGSSCAARFSLVQAPDGARIDRDSGLFSFTPARDQVGLHDLVVRLTDPGNKKTDLSFRLAVDSANIAPSFTSGEPPAFGVIGAAYSFDFEAQDPDPGAQLRYALVERSPGTGPSAMRIETFTGLFTFTPSADGTHAATVLVQDQQGGCTTKRFLIQVGAQNLPPVITWTPPLMAVAGALFEATVTATDANPGDILSYTLKVAPAGMTIDPNTGLIRWTPAAAQIGLHPLTVQVTDLFFAFDQDSVTLEVVAANEPPLITTLPPLLATEDLLYTYDADAIDDPGQVLTFSLILAPAGMIVDPVSGLVEWTPLQADVGQVDVVLLVTDQGALFDQQSFTLAIAPQNDAPVFETSPVTAATEDRLYVYDADASDEDPGDTLVFSLELSPAGMSIDPGTGRIEWTPQNADVGQTTVRLRATDQSSVFAEQTYTLIVTNVNDPPSFVSNPVIAARAGAAYHYTARAIDPDFQDVLSYFVATGPLGLSIGATTGEVSWTPVLADVGAHPVTLEAKDLAGATAVQSFTLTVIDQASGPLIISAPILSAIEDQLYVYDVEAEDPDPAAVLTFTLDLAPSGMTIDPVIGRIDWTPTNEQVGAAPVVVRATSGLGLIATQSFSITVENLNDPPVITSSPPLIASEGLRYSYLVAVSDPDANDAGTFSLGAAPTGATLDPIFGLLEWIPSDTQVGPNSFLVLYTDQAGASASQSFSVAVENENDAPFFTSSPPLTVTQHDEYFYDASADDLDLGRDPNEVLAFSIDTGPDGFSISAATGTCTFTANDDQFGDYAVRLRVTDAEGATDTQEYTLTVFDRNDPPAITSSPVLLAIEGQRYTYRATARDPDPNDTVTFALLFGPSGMTITSAGLLEFLPGSSSVGTQSVRLEARDAAGLFVEQAYVLTVENVNEPPFFTTAAVVTAAQRVPYSYLAFAADPDLSDIVRYTLDLGPSGLAIDPITGLVTWTPSPRQLDDYDVIIRATDVVGAFDLQGFAITVANTNDAPIFLSEPPVIATENVRYEAQIQAADPDVGDVITFSFRAAPPGMKIDPASGLITWVPASAQVGSHTVIVRATDLSSAFNEQIFELLVATNGAPCTASDTSARCSAIGVSYVLDRFGLPVFGATIDEVGPTASRLLHPDPASGLSTLGGNGAASYQWTASAPGYTSAVAEESLEVAKIELVALPRLSPLLDLFGVLLPEGSRFEDVNGAVELIFESGAVTAPSILRGAVLDGQSLPKALPLGYSPAVALFFEVEGALSIPPFAELRVGGALLANTPLILASYDESTRVWFAESIFSSGPEPEESPQFFVELGLAGTYALVIPDPEVSGAAVGQALPASPLAPPAPATLRAAGRVDPEVQLFSLRPEDVTAVARAELSAEPIGPLPSGFLLFGRLFESYAFSDDTNSEIATVDFGIRFYRFSGAQQSSGSPLFASFFVRPRFLLAGDGTVDITQRIEIESELSIAAQPIDAGGGSVSFQDGAGTVIVTAEPNVFSTPTVVSLGAVDASNLLAGEPAPIRAFRVDFSGGEPLGGPGRLTIDLLGLAPDKEVVLARREVSQQRSGWAPVERGRTDSAGRFVRTEPAQNALPGLDRPGTYALLTFGAPQGLVRGVVEEPAGAPVKDAIVEVEGTPWLLVTGVSGRFDLLGFSGTVTVRAERPSAGEEGEATGTLVDASSAVTLAVVVAARNPKVTRTTPPAGALNVSVLTPIELFFSEAMELAPEADLQSLISVTSTGGAISGRITLRPSPSSGEGGGDRLLGFLPDRPLENGRLFTVTLQVGLLDRDQNPPDGTVGFVFSTIPARGRARKGPALVAFAPQSPLTPCAPYDPDGVPPDFDPTGQSFGVPGFDPNDPRSTCVVGGAGVADPGVPVVLLNDESGATFTTRSLANGSFKGSLSADEEDLLSAVFVNDNGTQLLIPLEVQKFPDGSVALYGSGGTVSAENPFGPPGSTLDLRAEPGSIVRRTRLLLSPQSVGEVVAAADGVPPLDGTLLFGALLEASGSATQKPFEVRFPVDFLAHPLPDGLTPETAGFMLARVQKQVVDGESVVFYETLDKLEYENGALVSKSFPFLGLLLRAAELTRKVAHMLAVIVTSRFPAPVHGFTVACEATYNELGQVAECLPVLAEEGDAPSARSSSDVVRNVPPGRRLSGTVVTTALLSLGPFAPGRIPPGATAAISDAEGRYCIAVPNVMQGRVLIGRHPEFLGSPATAPVVGSTSQQFVTGLANTYANLIFDDAGRTFGAPGGSAIRPTIVASHAPLRPAPGQAATLRVVAQHPVATPRGITLRAVEVVALIPGETAAPSDLTISSTTAIVSSERKRITTFRLLAQKAMFVRFLVEVESEDVSATIGYAITFDGLVLPPPSETPSPEPNDTTGPRVESTWPLEGGMLELGASVLVRFNEAIADTSADAVVLVPAPAAGRPVVSSNDRGDELTIRILGLSPETAYSLTLLTAEIRDRSDHALDQVPRTPESDSFTLLFRTAPQVSAPLPNLLLGGGAVVHGIFAYVLDRSGTDGLDIKVYDLSNPAVPQHRPVDGIAIDQGYPRDLLIIPRFSYARPKSEGSPSPGQPSAGDCDAARGEVDWLRNLEGATAPVPMCAAFDRTLLAVTGGRLTSTPETVSTQYLKIFDVTNAGQGASTAGDPPSLFEVNGASIVRGGGATRKLVWSPPLLGYHEVLGTGRASGVNLSAFLFGLGLSGPQFLRMPLDFLGYPGVDLNHDGDYLDPNESLALPGQPVGGQVDLGFSGKRIEAFVDTPQTLVDFALVGRTGFVGSVLARSLPLFSGYRTLTTNYQNLLGPAGESATVPLFAFEAPEAVAAFLGVPVRVRTPAEAGNPNAGVLEILDLAVAGGRVLRSDGALERRLFLIDVSQVLSPRLLSPVEGIVVPGGEGFDGSLERIELDALGNTLRIFSAKDLVLLDLSLATMSAVAGSPHPSVLGLVPNVGTYVSANGASDYGVFVRAGEKQVVFNGPSVSFVSFPDARSVVFPEDLFAEADSGPAGSAAVERTLSKLLRSDVLRVSTTTDAAGGPDLSPPNVQTHYYVLVRAPGSAGQELRAQSGTGVGLPLLIESLNASGWLLLHPGAGVAPVIGASDTTLSRLKRLGLSNAAKSPQVFARRLSDNLGSALYNVFLSSPFALTHQAFSAEEVRTLSTVDGKQRPLFWSGAKLRASLDPELSSGVLEPFETKVSSTGQITVGTHVVAESFDAHRALGPNPSPVVGTVTVRGTSGLLTPHNGELTVAREDLSLPGRRKALSFMRSYRGQDRAPGPFGPGWDAHFLQRISELSPGHVPLGRKLLLVARGNGKDKRLAQNDVILHDGMGNAIHFAALSGAPPVEYTQDPLLAPSLAQALRVYQPEPGVFDALVLYDSGQWRRVTPGGEEFWYSRSGRLEKIYDRFEKNWVDLLYTSRNELRYIVARGVEPERYFSLGYYRTEKNSLFESGLDELTSGDPSKAGLIRRLLDTAGRKVEYGYDAELRLVTVEEDVGALGGRMRRLEYGYRSDDRLQTVKDGTTTGAPLFAAGLMDDDGRVKSGSGAMGSVLLSYVHENRASALLRPNGTLVLLADGSRERFEFNGAGLPEAIVSFGPSSPAPEQTSLSYNDEVNLEKVVAPRGNRTVFKYERDVGGLVGLRSQGNVRKRTYNPGPGSAGSAQSELLSFDARYNLPSGEQTDASGRTRTVALENEGKSIRRISQGISPDIETLESPVDATTGQLGGLLDSTGVAATFGYKPETGFLKSVEVGSGAPDNEVTTYGYEACVAGPGLGLPCTRTPGASAPEALDYTKGGFLKSVRKGASGSAYAVTMGHNPFGEVEHLSETIESGKERNESSVLDDLGQSTSFTLEGVETDASASGQNSPQNLMVAVALPPDALARPRQVVAPDGTTTVLDYDHRGRIQKARTGEFEEIYRYDGNGNLEAVEHNDGAKTEFDYDGHDRLVSVTDAEGGTLELEFDFLNGDLREARIEDPVFGVLAKVRLERPDLLGRPQSIHLGTGACPPCVPGACPPCVPGAGSSYTVTYTGRNRSVTGPDGIAHSLRLDTAGRIAHEEQSGVYMADYRYDPEGRLKTLALTTSGGNFGQSFVYDPIFGDLTHIKDAQGAVRTELIHRLDGAVTEVIQNPDSSDPANVVRTTIPRSVLGEALGEEEESGIGKVITRDALRRVKSVGPASGQRRGFVYDASARLTDIVHEDGSSTTFRVFDDRNQPQQITVPGGSMGLTYDKVGRPKSITTELEGKTLTLDPVKYDALGRARKMTVDGGDALSFDFDSLGVMTRTTVESGGRTMVFSRDPSPAGATSSIRYPSGLVLRHARDGGQRLVGLFDATGAETPIANPIIYATPRRAGEMTLGTGLKRIDVWDVRERLLRRSYVRASGMVAELRYAYDGADREVARQHMHRGGRTDFFSYDNDRRLSQADLAARRVNPQNLPLVMPLSGWVVLASAGTFLFGDVRRDYTFDGKDQLRAIASTTYDGVGVGPVVAGVAGTFGEADELGFVGVVDAFDRTRDALGDVKRLQSAAPASGSAVPPALSPIDLSYELSFSGEPRVRTATRSDGTTIDYRYRPDGVLLSRSIVCGSGAPSTCSDSTRSYVFDGLLLLEERELAPAPFSGEQVLARYIYAEEGDVPIAADFFDGTSMRRHYFVVDRQGSIMGVLDESGAWVERVRYDTYGTPLFEVADTQPPVLSKVSSAPGGDVVMVLSEPIVPRAQTPPLGDDLALAAVDLSTVLTFEDSATSQAVPGRVTIDLDAFDTPGVPVGSVLRFTPDATLAPGTLLTLRLAHCALVDDWNLGNADTSLAVTYGTGVSYTGPPPGSTQGEVASQSLLGNRLLFQSHFWDEEAGLYHMRARMFDPRTGTFLQRDPSGYEDSINLYAGFRHDPVNNRDPTGRFLDVVLIGALYGPEAAAGYVAQLARHAASTAVDAARGLCPVCTLVENPLQVKTALDRDREAGGAGVLETLNPMNQAARSFVAAEETSGFEKGVNVANTGKGIADTILLATGAARLLRTGAAALASRVGAGHLRLPPEAGRLSLSTEAGGLTEAAGGGVALDANSLIRAIEKGEGGALDAALAGRQPIVSIQAAKEFLRKGDANSLRSFLSTRVGRIGAASSEASAAALQGQAASLGRSLRVEDARVAGSALREGVPVITRDVRFRNFLKAVGIGGESF